MNESKGGDFKKIIDSIKDSFEALDRNDNTKVKNLYDRCITYLSLLTEKKTNLDEKIEKYTKLVNKNKESLQEIHNKVENAATEVKKYKDTNNEDSLRRALSLFRYEQFKQKAMTRENRDCLNTLELFNHLSQDIQEAINLLDFIKGMLQRSIDRLDAVSFSATGEKSTLLTSLGIDVDNLDINNKRDFRKKLKKLQKKLNKIAKSRKIYVCKTIKGIEKQRHESFWEIEARTKRPYLHEISINWFSHWTGKKSIYKEAEYYNFLKLFDEGRYEILSKALTALPDFLEIWDKKMRSKNEEFNRCRTTLQTRLRGHI